MRTNARPCIRKIEENFISIPAFYSIELNVYVLIFIFHCGRSSTSSFSTMTNFIVQQFIYKIRKISTLNQITTFEASNVDLNTIKFPLRHKQHQDNLSSSMLTNLDRINYNEESIYETYEYAKSETMP